MTVLEIMIVCSISVVVLTALIALSNSSAKMNKAALSSVTLQSALILQETIASDLRQLGVQPPPAAPLPLVAPRGISFYKCRFVGKKIRYRAVRYGVEGTPAGNMRLVRTEVTDNGPQRSVIDGLLTRLEFAVISDPDRGGAYLKISLSLIDDDVKPPQGRSALQARITNHDLLCRIPIPSERGMLRVSRMVTPEIEGPLLPLEP
jgi:hypothetical protein